MERICNNFALIIMLLFCAIATSLAQQTITTSLAPDQSSLLALKAHITSDPHQFLSKNWSHFANSSVCNWIGVTCDPLYHRVTALNISNMGLTGTIPPQLGNLSFLSGLDLSNNNFHGDLPPDLARLRELSFLCFNRNQFSGEVPGWLGSLPELQFLLLGTNHFSGPIPSSIFNLSKLEILYLSNNSLEGMIPLGIGKLNNLNTLAIDCHQLSGSLPFEIFNISTLKNVGLSRNNLFGNLPNNICSNFQKLEWLTLSNNRFRGEIPPMNLSLCKIFE